MDLLFLLFIYVRSILIYHLVGDSKLVQQFGNVVKDWDSFKFLHHFQSNSNFNYRPAPSKLKPEGEWCYHSSLFFFLIWRGKYFPYAPQQTSHMSLDRKDFMPIHNFINNNESTVNGLDGSWFIPLTRHLMFNNNNKQTNKNNKEFFNQKMEGKMTYVKTTVSDTSSSSSFIYKFCSYIHLF